MGSNVNFDLPFESQFDIFREFCQRFGNDYNIYQCSEKKMEEFLKEDTRKTYASLWNDVVSIQMNLLNGKLRQLFENTLNVNKNELNEFYKYFSCSRLFCVKLPINQSHLGVPQWDDFEVWPEMIEKFDGDSATTRKEVDMFDIGNLHPIYTFIVLWNGIFGMMHNGDTNYRHGFVTAIKNMYFNGCVIKTTKELEKKDNHKNSILFRFVFTTRAQCSVYCFVFVF